MPSQLDLDYAIGQISIIYKECVQYYRSNTTKIGIKTKEKSNITKHDVRKRWH